VDGEKFTTLRGDRIAEEFKELLNNYVVSHYGQGGSPASAH
jgi:(E)-4-hydroxy-3-methylbut-2-enyl-diphosphate synthase